jgi:hypothetical protein
MRESGNPVPPLSFRHKRGLILNPLVIPGQTENPPFSVIPAKVRIHYLSASARGGKIHLSLSFPRKRESRFSESLWISWIPAFAGMTGKEMTGKGIIGKNETINRVALV